MNFITIKGNKRESLNKKSLYNLRKNKQVPCVIYNANTNILFYTDKKSFNEILYTKKISIILIKIESNIEESIKCILYDVQFHPISEEIIHADFYKLSDDKYIILKIPIKIIGRSIGVSKGGEYSFPLKKLNIKVLPINIPSSINIDVSSLEIGDRISVKEIRTKKYNILHPDNTIIAAVRASRVSTKLLKDEINVKEEKNEK